MFKKGTSGNPAGRTKGSENRSNKETKELLKSILQRQLDTLDQRQEELTHGERIQLAKSILPYLLPRLQSTIIREGLPLGQFKSIEINLTHGDNNEL
jgi:hypothetical protein